MRDVIVKLVRKRVIRALYTLFFVFCYAIFLYLTFPSDVARERVLYEANKAGLRMQMVDLDLAFPWGVKLEGVDIYGLGEDTSRKKPTPRRKAMPGGEIENGAAPDAGAPAEGEAPAAAAPVPAPADAAPAPEAAVSNETPVLTLDSVRLDLPLPTALLKGDALSGLTFDAELYGGEAEGSYKLEGGLTRIVLAMTNLDLSRYPMQGESYDLKLAGAFGLNTDLSINKEKIRESTGTIALNLPRLVVHKGSKIKGFDIPMELDFKVTGGSMDVKNGRAELSEMVLESQPVTMKISGSVMLNPVMSRSRFNLKVALKFGDELKLIASLLPESARSDDGFYHYILSGPFNNLRTRPDRLAARRKDRGRTPGADVGERPTMPGMGAPPVPGLPPVANTMEDGGPAAVRPPILDDAERERLREERRRRAEERRRKREEMRQRRLAEMGGEDGGAIPPPPVRPMGLEQELNEDAAERERPQRRFNRPNEDTFPVEPEPDVPEGLDPQPWDEAPSE